MSIHNAAESTFIPPVGSAAGAAPRPEPRATGIARPTGSATSVAANDPKALRTPTAPPPPAVDIPGGTLDVFARTLWGEARGEGLVGMEAVACVIRNRAAHPGWWGKDIRGVCLAPQQFSCWNAGDPNLPKLKAVTAADGQFSVALQAANAAASGTLADITDGADSYFALHTPMPKWATSDKFIKNIGNHAFYRVQIPPPKLVSSTVRLNDRVRQACEASFPAHQDDCGAFARDVARQLNVSLVGVANDIVETIRGGGDWHPLSDGIAAARSAGNGKLVIAGLPGSEQVHPSEHGHVVVVVSGDPDRGYPQAYWGRLGGGGQKDKTINYAWQPVDRDHVSYAEHDVRN